MANFEVLKTPYGYVKVIQFILGLIAIGIMGDIVRSSADIIYELFPFANRGILLMNNVVFFFMLVHFGFLVTSFLLLVTTVFDDAGAADVRVSLFDIMYHLFGFIFFFSASVALFVKVASVSSGGFTDHPDYAKLVVSGVCSISNSVAYAANALMAYRLRPGN